MIGNITPDTGSRRCMEEWMETQVLDAIPADRRDHIRGALRDVCGTRAVTGMQPIDGGASGALIYRVDTDPRPYLLRVETRRGALRNPHQYVCMQTAADAGI